MGADTACRVASRRRRCPIAKCAPSFAPSASPPAGTCATSTCRLFLCISIGVASPKSHTLRFRCPPICIEFACGLCLTFADAKQNGEYAFEPTGAICTGWTASAGGWCYRTAVSHGDRPVECCEQEHQHALIADGLASDALSHVTCE